MVFQNDILAGAAGAGGGYTINQSIRFNRDDSAYLTRTPSSASNRRTFTLSFWWKMCTIPSTTSGGYRIIAAGSTEFGWSDTNDSMYLNDGSVLRATNQKFRDTSAWQHVVIAADTTSGTADDRLKLYINGEQVTSWLTNNTISQNFDFDINNTVAQNIGKEGANYIGAYVAEFHSVDGTQLDATSFGETNDDGVWIPKAYSGSYGTNGFYLKGQDSSNLGDDSSGNGNDFTSSGLTSDDQRADTPTNNLMTFNPLNNMRDDGDPTDGNRVFKNTGSTRNLCGTTFHFNTDKYVQAFSASAVTSNGWQMGTMPSDEADVNDAPGSNEDLNAGVRIQPITNYYVGGTGATTDTGITADANDTYWVAIDLDAGKQWVGIYDDSDSTMKWFDSSAGTTGDPAAGSNPTSTVTANDSFNFAVCGRSSVELTLLEESEATAGTIPTGFTYVGAAQDAYAAPTINDGSAHFFAKGYTGTGVSGTSITNDANAGDFKPDLLIVTPRNIAENRVVFDSVRGTTSRVYTNKTDPQDTDATALITFETNGFDLDTTDGNYNGSGNPYIAWQWHTTGGTSGSNTDGSITSTVSANTTAKFSVITYTGTGSAATVGHGLGAEPQFIAIKGRTNTDSWGVYPGTSMGYGGQYRLKLNETSSVAASSVYWNDTDATSSVFTVNTDAQVNGSGVDYVAFCFAEVEGFSKFGQYTGNANTAGPFVWCGFRPAWVMLKRADSADNWVIIDSTRDPINVADGRLYPDQQLSEVSSTTLDLVSNGFKLRASDGGVNGSGGTYVFMAFAENPFGGDGVAPVPAR